MNEIRDIENLDTDIVIVGSGAAGLTLALRTADFARVTVLSKGDLQEGATYYAQGASPPYLMTVTAVTLMLKTPCAQESDFATVTWWSMLLNAALLRLAGCAQGVPFTTKSVPGGTYNDAAPSSQAELSSST